MKVPADVGFLMCVLSASSPQNSRGGSLTHTMRAPCERIRVRTNECMRETVLSLMNRDGNYLKIQ